MSNLEKLKRAYQIWDSTKGSDTTCWENLFAEQVNLHSVDEQSPGMEFAKDRHSKAEASKYLSAILDNWEMLHWTPNIFVEQDSHIAMFGRCAWRSKQTGKSVEVDIAHLFDFEDDKITGIREVFDSAKAMLAATPA